MVAINYRTDDANKWGNGLGGNLAAEQVDANFYEIAQAITALQTDRPKPNNIASITVTQTSMTIFLDDGTPFVLPLPVLAFSWRGEWAPNTVYDVLDVFTVELQGLFVTKILHTSDSEAFNDSLLIDGDPVYQKLIGVAPIAPASYVAPATGATYTADALERRLIIDPASAIAALTIILPPSPIDGDDFEILSSQAIATVTVTAGTATVKGSGFALPANGTAKWVYRESGTTWFGEVPKAQLKSGQSSLDGSNPTVIAHGMNTCTAAFVQLIRSTAPGAPGLGTSLLTCEIDGASVNIFAWKPTSSSNPTWIASTGTEDFFYHFIGT